VRKKSVWVRISPPLPDSKMDPNGLVDSQRFLRLKKKRRRSKGGKTGVGASRIVSPGSADGVDAILPMPRLVELGDSRPPLVESRVLAFYDELAREEIKLRRALFVTIVETRPEVHGSDVLEEVARSFEVNVRDMSIHQANPEDFLLFLPGEDTATRVLNGGRFFVDPRFNLLFKSWSRFSHASSSVMYQLVDVVVRGLPEHAWFRSTAEVILEDSCFIEEVHLDIVHKRDFSSFAVRTRCFDPERLQRNMILHISEPGPQSNEARFLSYNISVQAIPVNANEASMRPPADPSTRTGGDDRSSASNDDVSDPSP
jgi:hypothetical protein